MIYRNGKRTWKNEEEKRSIEEGKVQWEQIQEDIDKFVAWCLTARETYPNATYEEKRRAIRFLGIVVYVYREKDPENPYPDQRHYDIKAGFPDIVFRMLYFEVRFLYQSVDVSSLPCCYPLF